MEPVKYYKTNFGALRIRELWRFCHGDLFLLINALTMKLSGTRSDPMNVSMHNITIKPLEEAELPGMSRTILVSRVKQCEAIGCRLAFYYSKSSLSFVHTTAAAMMHHNDLRIGVIIIYSAVGNNQPRIVTTCLSFLPDGKFLETSNASRYFDHQRNVRFNFPGASAQEIIYRHTERLDELKVVRPMPLDRNEIREMLEGEEQKSRDDFLARGIIVPMSETEIQTYLRLEKQHCQLQGDKPNPSSKARRVRRRIHIE